MTNLTKRNQEVTMVVPIHTIGLDTGDRKSHACVMDVRGEVVQREAFGTTAVALSRFFTRYPGARVALEVGTHSPWISRHLKELHLEVIVANPRKVRLIGENDHKNDPMDAELLARLARVDPQLLYPIHHRGIAAQADLNLLNARDALVANRTRLINHVRGSVKSLGARLPSCSAGCFARRAGVLLPPELVPALEPILKEIERITATIRIYDRQIEKLCNHRYPETVKLRQVAGVGPITALAFVLTLEDPRRFRRSRMVGAYLGLVPRQRDSGDHRPKLRISKAGDAYLRRLLVTSAHYILGPFGPDCTLRHYGQVIVAKGGKGAKKRAVVAVARKLAGLLHRLWIDGKIYDPRLGLSEAA